MFPIFYRGRHPYTPSSQPSSSCSRAAPRSISARCTRVWCPLWPPASSEGFLTTGRSLTDAPSACAAPWLRSTWEKGGNCMSGSAGGVMTCTSQSSLEALLNFLTWDPENQKWRQNPRWSQSWWACEGIQRHACRTWKRFRHPVSWLPSPPSL